MSDVTSRITADFLAYLREHAIPVAPLVDGLDLCIADLTRPGARLSWDDFTAVLERFTEMIGGMDGFERFLMRSLEHKPSWMQPIIAIASLCTSPEMLYRALNVLVTPVLFRPVRAAVERQSHNGTKLRIRMEVPRHLRPSLVFFETMVIGSRALPLLLGMAPSRVEATEIGAHHLELFLTTPRRIPILIRLRDLVRHFRQSRLVLEEALHVAAENAMLPEKLAATEALLFAANARCEALAALQSSAAPTSGPELSTPDATSMCRQRQSLRPFLSAVFAAATRRAAKSGVAMLAAIDPTIGETMVASEALEQITQRLLDHALAMTSSGMISVTAGLDREGTRKHAMLDLRIRATGVGKILPLEAFRDQVRSAGGDVALETSVPGRGSILALTLPLLDVPPPARDDTFHFVPLDALPSLTDVRVLLVEDDEDLRLVYAEFLRLAGVRVEEAADGAAGMRRALAEQHDLLILDVQMPNLDGYEVARQLRDAGYERPIIALTAHALVGERERALLAGCDEHVSKPIELGRLIATVAKWTSGVGLG